MTAAAPPPPPPAWGTAAPAPGYYVQSPGTSGYSIAALVLGIVSIACGGLGFFLVPPVLAERSDPGSQR